jgi:hypothetical protein
VWSFRNSQNLETTERSYEKGLRYIQVTLYTMLKTHYSADMDVESASVLAAQVVNFLKGDAIENVIASCAEPLKSQITQIKDRIPEHAYAAMTMSRGVREVVVATLRMRTVIAFSRMGAAYFQTDEKKRIEHILSTYGAEFPKEIDANSYLAMAQRFRDSGLQNKAELR